MAFYVNCDTGNSFGVEHIPKKIKTFIANKNITRNIFRIQTYNSIMCEYFCIGLIDFILKVKVCYIILIYFLSKNMRRMTK